jgi:hypothetical protein
MGKKMNPNRLLGCEDSYGAFSREAFACPEAKIGPSFTWVWNDVLSNEKIEAEIAEMARVGIRSVYVLPEPKRFRPGFMETRLEPDYLSDEYFAYFRHAMECARAQAHHQYRTFPSRFRQHTI